MQNSRLLRTSPDFAEHGGYVGGIYTLETVAPFLYLPSQIPSTSSNKQEEAMPARTIAVASALGGLTLFVWGALSHTLVPLYNNALHRFTNQDAVTQAIATNAPQSGTYFLPNYPDYSKAANDAERTAMRENMERQMMSGPAMFAHVRVGPMGSIAPNLVTELVANIIAALFLTILMSTATQLSLKMRMYFAVGVALVMVFDQSVSSWNWYGAGADFFVAETVDAVVGWALAGLVIGKLLGKPAQ